MNAPIEPEPLPVQIQARSWAQAQHAEAKALLPVVREMQITSPEQAEAVNEILKQILRVKDEVEAKRKAWVGPLNGVVKSINDEFRPARETLESIERTIKAALANYARAQIEAQRGAYQLAAQAMQAGDVSTMTAALAVVNQEPVKLAGTSTRDRWVAEVIAPDMLPDAYTKRVPDLDKIKAVAADAPTDGPAPVVPGVKFTLESIVTTRR
jgi:hypothetical protein